jgi:hypothetical protein
MHAYKYEMLNTARHDMTKKNQCLPSPAHVNLLNLQQGHPKEKIILLRTTKPITSKILLTQLKGHRKTLVLFIPSCLTKMRCRKAYLDFLHNRKTFFTKSLFDEIDYRSFSLKRACKKYEDLGLRIESFTIIKLRCVKL